MTHNVQILDGKEGIKQGYNLMLEEDSLDIVCLADSYQKVLGDFFDRQYAPKLYTRPTREILPDTNENRDYALKKEPKNEVRFLKAGSESDLVIGKKQVLLISFNSKSPLGILISDPELVSHFQAQFEALWAK